MSLDSVSLQFHSSFHTGYPAYRTCVDRHMHTRIYVRVRASEYTCACTSKCVYNRMMITVYREKRWGEGGGQGRGCWGRHQDMANSMAPRRRPVSGHPPRGALTWHDGARMQGHQALSDSRHTDRQALSHAFPHARPSRPPAQRRALILTGGPYVTKQLARPSGTALQARPPKTSQPTPCTADSRVALQPEFL